MVKYMVVVQAEDEVFAKFFSDLSAAEQHRSIAECSLGWYAEVYEYDEEDGYKLLYC